MEISRARDRAELVTDDAKALREQLEAVTGERISALEGIGDMARAVSTKVEENARTTEGQPDRAAGRERSSREPLAKDRELPVPERGLGAGMGLEL